ncbi:hypothetical protein [Streptomyces lydicus]|nr:hypothetical protein [Streptomyces lydicus]
MEWTRPEYADVVASMKMAEAAIGSNGEPPLRGFLIPDPPAATENGEG